MEEAIVITNTNLLRFSCGNSLIPSDSSDVEAHEKYAREEPFTEEGT